METLDNFAITFSAVTRLRDAVWQLERLEQGQCLDAGDREVLGWAGNLLQALDETGLFPKGGARPVSPTFAVEVRPAFYTSVLGLREVLVEHGIGTRVELRGLFGELLDVLKGATASDPATLRVGAALLSGMADDLEPA